MNRQDDTAAHAAAALEPLLERFAGKTALVFASGPSLPSLWSADRPIPLPSIAVSDAWRIVPSADVVVASDSLWWMHHKGLPDYHGIKVGSRSDGGGLPAGVVALQNSGEAGYDDRLGWFRHGHGSGYAAAHLAAQLGARRIVLVGFDMKQIHGQDRWFGPHPEPLRRPTNELQPYAVWIMRFAELGKALAARCVELVNATPKSALTLPTADLEAVCRVN